MKQLFQARRVVMERWRSALDSGLRAALACTIVGLVSLYAPPVIRRHVTFPAFSYVVTVIIVTDATLGTALRGAVSAIQATLMGAAPSVLALWLAHHTGAAESVLATSAVVALTTFAVALPESVGPVAKRIALGQIIIIYVARFQQGERPTLGFALIHPANVVACTALGAAAALLAVLLPWPILAILAARDMNKAYKVLVAERVRVMADAFVCGYYSDDHDACRRRRRRRRCMSEAKRLASASTTLLRHRINESDARWERAIGKASGFCKWAQDDANHHQDMETPLTGMQMALAMMGTAASSSDNLADLVMTTKDQIRLALLDQGANSTITNNKQSVIVSLPAGNSKQELAPLLFLFSLYQLHCASASPGMETDLVTGDAKMSDKDQNQILVGRLTAAAKCGFSLGLAVLLGLLFSKDHGFWSGLIVATTMAAGRESTWALGIARAHGTALGSVYGMLGCLLISQTTMDLRFLALVPWMVLSTFLKRSRAYGPAGGVAAALSAVIIMGRRYDEAPMAFTISRLVETFIGISCAILADLVFQPGEGRPSVQAREQLTRCIAVLKDCFGDDHSHQNVQRQQLALLTKYMAEARSEPTYLWLPPFPESAYHHIQRSLSRMTQQLQLFRQARAAASAGVHVLAVDDFNRVVSSSLNHCLQLATKSTSSVQDEDDDDLEAAKCCSCCGEEMTPEEVVGSFLAHSREALLLLKEEEDAEMMGVCCLASMALCMGEIMNESAHILDLSLFHIAS